MSKGIRKNKTKNGYTYEINFQICDSNNQTRRFQKGGFSTVKEAEVWKQQTLNKVKEFGAYFEEEVERQFREKKAKEKTLNEVFNEWLENDTQELANQTINSYKSLYNKYVSKTMGDYQLRLINYGMVKSFFNDRLEDGVRFSNRKLIKCCLMSVINYAIKCEYVSQNVVSLVKLSNDEIKKEKRIILEEEHKAICNSLIDEYGFYGQAMAIACNIALYGGLRYGEIMGLEKSDIDFKENVIRVSKQLQCGTQDQKREHFEICPTKTKNGVRDIPIAPQLKELLLEWFNINPYEKVVCDIDGEYMIKDCFHNKLERVLKENHIIGVTFHCYRHTFATNCVYEKMELKDLQTLMGHSNIQTTLGVYTHATNERLQSSISKVFTKKCGLNVGQIDKLIS